MDAVSGFCRSPDSFRHSVKFAASLLGAFGVIFIALAINPATRTDGLLENVIAIVVLQR